MGKALEPTHKSGHCKLLRSFYSQLLSKAEKGGEACVDRILNEKEKKNDFLLKRQNFSQYVILEILIIEKVIFQNQ
jgi:hypothetical protein